MFIIILSPPGPLSWIQEHSYLEELPGFFSRNVFSGRKLKYQITSSFSIRIQSGEFPLKIQIIRYFIPYHR